MDIHITCLHRKQLIQAGTCTCGDGDVWVCGFPRIEEMFGPAPRMPGRACCAKYCKFYAEVQVTGSEWQVIRRLP